jgi:hypothetical protein
MAAAAVAVAGCGSSSHGTVTGTAGKGDDMVAFAACMRSHGVTNFPDPGTNGASGISIALTQHPGSAPSATVNGVAVAAPAFQAGMQACHSKLPNGGKPPAAQTAARRAQALAMAKCMRSHGVPNYPDPQFGTGPGGLFRMRLGPGPNVNPNSPAFRSAVAACQPAKGGTVTTG